MSDASSTADVMVDSLAAAGVTDVFAYPGDPIIELMERFRAKGIDVVLARREGTAAFMAEGLAMATGKIGVCMSTLGPGSTALVNGVAAATLDRVPMIAIRARLRPLANRTSPIRSSITSCCTHRLQNGLGVSSRRRLARPCVRHCGSRPLSGLVPYT